MPPEQRPSFAPNASEKPMSGRLSGLTRGVINVVIGTLAAGAGERLAVGDTRSAVIIAAFDGGIIVADTIATGFISRRVNSIAQQQQATIEAQAGEIATLRRGNSSDNITS